MAIAAQDTVNYYEQRTGDDGMRSIDARIAYANNEVEELTNSFIWARNDLLRTGIERKMGEQEILLKDLYALKAQIELERGMKITKEKIVDFVALLLRGNPSDKDYQKKIIDNLVHKVYVYDDTVVTYLNMQGKDIETISLAETDKAIESLMVQTSSIMVDHNESYTNGKRYIFKEGIFGKVFGSAMDEKTLKKNLTANCIPLNIADYDSKKYQVFLANRRKLMAAKIKEYYLGL